MAIVRENLKARILFLTGFVLLMFSTISCTSAFGRVRDLPEGVPVANYNGRVIQAFIPTYYDEKTGCYISSKPSARLNNDSKFTVVNSFASGENAKIGFLLILKPKTRFMFSGDEYFALYHFNEKEQDWEQVAYTLDVSAPLWKYGNIVGEDRYLNIGKEKCHFIPESPIFIYPQDENGMIDGKYRLYVWGFEYSIYSFAFIGDYIDFTLGQGE